MLSRAQLFRVFVSSTFDDFQDEREALKREVFDPLDALCRASGCTFQAVDLRWGISQAAAREQLTMRICLEEVTRCRESSPALCFLGLVGERYGWCPLPDEVASDLFERVRAFRPVSPWSRLYREDTNAVPPVYCLLPRDEWAPGVEAQERAEAELRHAFATAARELEFSPDERVACCGSATEQEFRHGALAVGGEGALCFLRHFEGEPPAGYERYRESGPGSAAVTALREELRRCLPADRILEYAVRWDVAGVAWDYLPRFCGEVRERLEGAIRAELSRDAGQDGAALEGEEHEEYGRKRTDVFVGRREHLESLEAYVLGTSRAPRALVGPSGSGKSSLLANAVRRLRPKLADNILLQRFVGATPQSCDPVSLLQGLCFALLAGYADRLDAEKVRKLRAELSATSTYERLVGVFRNCLSFAAGDRPLLLVVDALDQLDGAAEVQAFPWIPPELPPWVKMIVSASPHVRRALERTVPLESFLDLGELSAREAEDLVESLLGGAGSERRRRLAPAQWSAVRERLEACSLPLYVKILFEQIRGLRSYEAVGDLGTGTSALVTGLLERLAGGSRHGSELVWRTLGLLAAAKNGITDEEMLSLLSRDAKVRREFRRRYPKSPRLERGAPLPQIVWSRLYFDLRPYLTLRKADGTRVLSFFHLQFAEIAKSRALSGPQRQEHHRALADFFARQPLQRGVDGRHVPDARKTAELPFQQAEAGLWGDAVDTLTDFAFLDAKVRVSGPVSLLQDFARLRKLGSEAGWAPAPEEGAALTTVERALELSSRALASDSTQLSAQLVGRVRPGSWRRLKRLISQAAAGPGPWLRPVTRSLTDPEGALRRTVGIHLHPVRCACVLPDGATVVSGSEIVSRAGDSTLKVWDLHTGLETGVLPDARGGVLSVCTAGDLVVAGLEDGSLGVWNPAGGGRIGVGLQGHAGPVAAVAALPGGYGILSGSYDGTIRFWDPGLGAGRIVAGHEAGVNGLAVAPDAGVVVSVCHDGTARIWDLDGFALRRELRGHTGSVDGVAVSGDGLLAATASADGSVILWDAAGGAELSRLSAEGQALRSVGFFEVGGRAFVAAGGDQGGVLFVWDRRSGELVQRLGAHTFHIYGLAWARQAGLLLTASGDTSLKVWDTGALVERARSEARPRVLRPRFFELDATGRFARAAGPEEMHWLSRGACRYVDLSTGDLLRNTSWAPRPGTTFDDQPWRVGIDGRFEARTRDDLRDVELLDRETAGKVAWRAHEAPIMALAASADGRLLATASQDYTVRGWDLTRRAATPPTLAWALEEHGREVNCVAIARATSLLVSGSDDWSAILWDFGGEKPVRIARFDAEGPLVACQISPDGGRIAIADEAGTVHVLEYVR